MLNSKNVNSMFSSLAELFYENPDVKLEESRNGKVLSYQKPLILRFEDPRERVLFHPLRHANPIFHLMEALWMLAGRNDVAFVRQFNSQMYTYSDDGVIFNAAYGHRWRNHFGQDQLLKCIDLLGRDPETRRAVIGMWSPAEDLDSPSLDIPCNTHLYFRIIKNKLTMTTCNRSNDLVWGLLGANCVHLTILQEFMAAALNIRVGCWYHMTNNLHVYEHHWKMITAVAKERFFFPDYPPPVRLVVNPERFLKECQELCDGKDDYFEEPFFDETVAPMIQSWKVWKSGDTEHAQYLASCIGADDWRKGTLEWYTRAIQRRNQNGSD